MFVHGRYNQNDTDNNRYSLFRLHTGIKSLVNLITMSDVLIRIGLALFEMVETSFSLLWHIILYYSPPPPPPHRTISSGVVLVHRLKLLSVSVVNFAWMHFCMRASVHDCVQLRRILHWNRWTDADADSCFERNGKMVSLVSRKAYVIIICRVHFHQWSRLLWLSSRPLTDVTDGLRMRDWVEMYTTSVPGKWRPSWTPFLI